MKKQFMNRKAVLLPGLLALLLAAGCGRSDDYGSPDSVNSALKISLPKTGQTTSYAAGDDGDMQQGVAVEGIRFTDNNNGTVTDNLTGLVWLKNANCFGANTWAYALTSANFLASGACGLTDGSRLGQWRLPNIVELESLVDLHKNNPVLPAGYFFTVVQSGNYWSSSTNAGNTNYAWYLNVGSGQIYSYPKSDNIYLCYAWPVRDR